MLRFLSLLLATAILAWTPVVSADPSRAELRYDRGPSECPFRSHVLARLGYDPFSSPSPNARVTISVRAKGHVFSARITIADDERDVSKERDGAGDPCPVLMESVATTVAMALDPIAASAPRDTTTNVPAQEVEQQTIASSARERDVVTPVASAPSAAVTPWTAYAGAAGAGALGELPGASVSGSVAFEMRRAKLGLLADGRFATTTTKFVSDKRDTLDTSLLAAGVAPCFRTGVIGACVHLRVGALRGRSETVTTPAARSALYAEVSASVQLRAELGERIEGFGFLELGAPVNPVTLEISGEEVWHAAPIFARIGVGAALGFLL